MNEWNNDWEHNQLNQIMEIIQNMNWEYNREIESLKETDIEIKLQIKHSRYKT